jgi:hypothetical protein
VASSTKGAIIGGCLGLVIMFVMIESDVEASGFMLLLWPSAVFGSLHGQGDGIFGVIVGAIEVGVQFLIYSALGWIVGAIVRIARREG